MSVVAPLGAHGSRPSLCSSSRTPGLGHPASKGNIRPRMEAGGTASTPARQAAPRRSAGRRGPLLQGPSRPPSTSPCRLAPGARVPGTYVVEGSRRIADRGVGDLPATSVLRRCQQPWGQLDPASSRRRVPILRPREPPDLGPYPERSHAFSDISPRPVRPVQALGSGSIVGHFTQEKF